MAVIAVIVVSLVQALNHRTHTAAKQPPSATSAPVATSGPTSVVTSSSAGPSTVPAKPRPGLASARAIDALIGRSVAARGLIGVPIKHITQCEVTQSDIDQLAEAARIRRSLVGELKTLKVSGLVGGALVVSRLEQAWTFSAKADDGYSQWGIDNQGCFDVPIEQGDDAFAQLTRYNKLSTHMKELVTPGWNAIAARYGLPQRTYKAI